MSPDQYAAQYGQERDTSAMSAGEKADYQWERIQAAAIRSARNESRLAGEGERCPMCQSELYFVRKNHSNMGKEPAPMCMSCSYTGQSYRISQLNQ
jgi:transposase-like protein